MGCISYGAVCREKSKANAVAPGSPTSPNQQQKQLQAPTGNTASGEVQAEINWEVERAKKVKEVQKKIKGFVTVEKINMARDVREK